MPLAITGPQVCCSRSAKSRAGALSGRMASSTSCSSSALRSGRVAAATSNASSRRRRATSSSGSPGRTYARYTSQATSSSTTASSSLCGSPSDSESCARRTSRRRSGTSTLSTISRFDLATSCSSEGSPPVSRQACVIAGSVAPSTSAALITFAASYPVVLTTEQVGDVGVRASVPGAVGDREHVVVVPQHLLTVLLTQPEVALGQHLVEALPQHRQADASVECLPVDVEPVRVLGVGTVGEQVPQRRVGALRGDQRHVVGDH